MHPAPSDLLLPVAMAAAAGLIGSVAVMRRMALASDALSHVALPGVAMAVLLHLNPVLGGLAALFLGSLLVWALEHKTRLPTTGRDGDVPGSQPARNATPVGRHCRGLDTRRVALPRGPDRAVGESRSPPPRSHAGIRPTEEHMTTTWAFPVVTRARHAPSTPGCAPPRPLRAR
jgi:hypothetical protein